MLPHQDTETHVWTKYGHMPRTALIATTGGHDNADETVAWAAYHDKATGELVRRDAHVLRKKGLEIGFKFSTQGQAA